MPHIPTAHFVRCLTDSSSLPMFPRPISRYVDLEAFALALIATSTLESFEVQRLRRASEMTRSSYTTLVLIARYQAQTGRSFQKLLHIL